MTIGAGYRIARVGCRGAGRARGRVLRGGGSGPCRTRAAMLLEVIVSIGLLLFGMVMVGLQVNAGLDAARRCDIGTRALMLADTKLSELDAGFLQPELYEEELKGDFAVRYPSYTRVLYPGYTWRMTMDLTDIDGFYKVKLEIGFNEEGAKEQLEDPDYELDIEDEGTLIKRTVYRLCPKPADANPERDFGLTEEQADRFFEALTEAAATGLTGVPEGGDDAIDAERAAELLRDLMQSFSETGSFDLRFLSQLPEEEFMLVAGVLEALYGRGGADALEQLQGLLPSGGRQPRGDGGRPPPDGGPGMRPPGRRDGSDKQPAPRDGSDKQPEPRRPRPGREGRRSGAGGGGE